MADEREQVLVVPADVLGGYHDMFRDCGLVVTQSNVAYADELTGDLFERAFFMDREAAETDPSFLQLIPYCVLVTPLDQTGELLAFGYRRTKKCGESRLHDKWAFGVGGHVNPVDADPRPGAGHGPTYAAALKRELKEEVGLDFIPPDDMPDFGLHDFAPLLGFIFDPSNDVGKVHLGLVHKVWVGNQDELKFEDPAMTDGRWFTRTDLAAGAPDGGSFEGWSAVVVDRFADKLFGKW